MNYLRDPAAIYAQSFAAIRAEANLSNLPVDAGGVGERIVHACGMPEIVVDLRISRGFVAAARQALRSGHPVICDSEMVRHGIIARQLPKQAELVCYIDDARAKALALANKTTRSAAAVELWRPRLDGALVVIGNAPTALFALLEALDDGAPRPAAIVAFPVGFVGAAESKEELHRDPRAIPYATLLGRRGGSAMAAAAVNAISAELAE